MAASRNARLIYGAESLARETFDTIAPTGDGSCARTINLQKKFRWFARLARQEFESVKAELAIWRDRVRCGDVEFTSERENNLKAALHASASFLSFMIEKFDDHYKNDLFLMNTKHIGFMEARKIEAERILNSWQSPEWETLDERTVEWNKEQTEHLRKRLGMFK